MNENIGNNNSGNIQPPFQNGIKKCPVCNFEYPDNVLQCPRCGFSATPIKKKSKFYKKWWFWLVICAAALLAFLGVLSVGVSIGSEEINRVPMSKKINETVYKKDGITITATGYSLPQDGLFESEDYEISYSFDNQSDYDIRIQPDMLGINGIGRVSVADDSFVVFKGAKSKKTFTAYGYDTDGKFDDDDLKISTLGMDFFITYDMNEDTKFNTGLLEFTVNSKYKPTKQNSRPLYSDDVMDISWEMLDDDEISLYITNKTENSFYYKIDGLCINGVMIDGSSEAAFNSSLFDLYCNEAAPKIPSYNVLELDDFEDEVGTENITDISFNIYYEDYESTDDETPDGNYTEKITLDLSGQPT